tara:strand:- start:1214 stop:1459 length:246 start_codon:yes stop_codon:yes gene_type:complete
MSNLTTLFIFFITWWLVLFTTLPFGIRRVENPGERVEVGAPERPQLWVKMGITTVVSLIFTGVLRICMDKGIISLKDLALL